MKKIINGKKYDTETATKIHEWWNGLACNDFRSKTEALYKKKTGEYFLHGEGGAMTRYAQSNGNTSWGGSAIVPLTLEEAKTWAENQMNADDYESIFGEVTE